MKKKTNCERDKYLALEIVPKSSVKISILKAKKQATIGKLKHSELKRAALVVKK